MRYTKEMALALLTVLVPVGVWASLGPGSEDRPPKPPQEAIDACQDKAEGATVEMSSPRGDTLVGVCRQLGGVLVVVPEKDGPPPIKDAVTNDSAGKPGYPPMKGESSGLDEPPDGKSEQTEGKGE